MKAVAKTTQHEVLTKRAFTEAEAAHYIGMSRSFLRQARSEGARRNRTPPPPAIRVGSRSIRYLREDLDAWLNEFAQKRLEVSGTYTIGRQQQ